MTQLDWELICETASKLGVKQEALRKWRQPRRGIPPRWWIPLIEKSKGQISVEALKASKRSAA